MEQKNVVNRRQAHRFDASSISSLKSVHLGEGPEIKLINISMGGALIETQERMSPGSSVSLRVVTTEAVHLIEGRILRCNANTIGEGSVFQSAVTFNKDFTILPLGQETD
jgi:hypothetical protein